MKVPKAWSLFNGDIQIMAAPRHRTPSKRPVWIIILLSLVCVSLIGAYVYPQRNYSACYFLSSSICSPIKDWLPPVTTRFLTDQEIASNVVIRDILSAPSVQSDNSKIAFMFLTPGSLPFEKLWEKFFLVHSIGIGRPSVDNRLGYLKFDDQADPTSYRQIDYGHEDRFSIYVHASKEKPVHVSPLFIGRDIRSEKVVWGTVSMLDAEKRLLANALQDSDNQHFVLLSDSCVPLHTFDYVYNYLLGTNISFIDCFEDPGPHGTGRYSEHMLPEIEKKDWRKGAQWFSIKRQHAVLILADSLYHTKFKLYCKPAMEGRNCYADEHYLPTLFHMVDPGGIANWSVTHVDWSEGKWHPKAYRAQDVTYELVKNITSIDESFHITSDERKLVQQKPCLWKGMKRPCYLFARKFYPEALDNLMLLFSNFTSV